DNSGGGTGDLSLTSTAEDKTGLPGGKGLYYSGDAEITVGNGGAFTGHKVTLHSGNTPTIKPQSLDFSVVQAAFSVGLSKAGVTISGGSITAHQDLKVEAVSNVTSDLEIASKGNSSSSADAVVSSAILKSEPTVSMTAGTLHADGTASLTTTNTVNA